MKMKGEQQLFNPGPAVDRSHPGDLSYEEWSTRPDVVHHSTFTRDWTPRDGVGGWSHYGTTAAAEENALRSYKDLDSVAEGSIPSGRPGGVQKDDDGWSDTYLDDVAEATGPGVIHSRRITESGIGHDITARRYTTHAADMRLSDAAANVAQKGFEIANRMADEITYGDSSYEQEAGTTFGDAAYYADDPDSMALTPQDPVARGIDHIYENTPVAYENEVEDQGSTSYMAPAVAVTSWEQDVQSSPNRSQHFKDAVAAQPRPRTTPFTGASDKAIRGFDQKGMVSRVIQPALFGEQGETATPPTGLHDGSRYHKEFPKEIPNPVHAARGYR